MNKMFDNAEDKMISVACVNVIDHPHQYPSVVCRCGHSLAALICILFTTKHRGTNGFSLVKYYFSSSQINFRTQIPRERARACVPQPLMNTFLQTIAGEYRMMVWWKICSACGSEWIHSRANNTILFSIRHTIVGCEYPSEVYSILLYNTINNESERLRTVAKCKGVSNENLSLLKGVCRVWVITERISVTTTMAFSFEQWWLADDGGAGDTFSRACNRKIIPCKVECRYVLTSIGPDAQMNFECVDCVIFFFIFWYILCNIIIGLDSHSMSK